MIVTQAKKNKGSLFIVDLNVGSTINIHSGFFNLWYSFAFLRTHMPTVYLYQQSEASLILRYAIARIIFDFIILPIAGAVGLIQGIHLRYLKNTTHRHSTKLIHQLSDQYSGLL